MRPTRLNPLFASVTTLNGVGPRFSKLLTKLLNFPQETREPRILDLVWHLPTGIIDRSARPKVKDAEAGSIATLRLTVVRHRPSARRGKAPYRVLCEDETDQIELIFFRSDRKYLEQVLPSGSTRYVSGRVELYNDKRQMPHPDYIMDEEEFNNLPLLEPIYPLTAGLTLKVLRKAISQAVDEVPFLEEWQNKSWLAKNHWPDFNSAIKTLHYPEQKHDISLTGTARSRLAYDELLANQLALALVRLKAKKITGRRITGTGKVQQLVADKLPFTLTSSQRNAISEILSDMAGPHRMLRLLQGDVGSGKTMVALMAMVYAVEAKLQSALMAPTEVLARQHFQTLEPLCRFAGLSVDLLTGREKGKNRENVLNRLESGEIDILIGTHALFQPDVKFKDLGFAVIDEQHRFGVHQRLALQDKGGTEAADILVMTATPIPRTLLLTHYGDIEVSRITEKPAGRKPVVTRAIPFDRIEEILSAIRRALAQGAQIYWICPLVDTSNLINLAAAEQRYAHLTQYFGTSVGLVHGQMSGREKDRVMAAFNDGQLSILVATTVIEVGVDVPNASVMVIEHAERFGLAQLHQLRGRVGRGQRQSSCILLYHAPLGETARARLKIMRETEDGFVIAEEDLKLRGGGEVLGTRQSGIPEFRIANVPSFESLLNTARDDATLVLNEDPGLLSSRGQALRTLLYLFECDEAVKLFQAG